MENTEPHGSKRLYCYRSLGQIECFRQPQKGREAQLVNYYTDSTIVEEEC